MLRQQRIVLYFAILLIILSGIVFYYNHFVIPDKIEKAKSQLRFELDDNAMPKVKVAVITAEEGISKYTVITEEIIDSKIKILEIPEKYAIKRGVIDFDLIKNKIAKEDLRFEEQISLDSLSSEKKWFGDFERLREYSVRNIVAGQVKTGNIVDILVSYDNGDFDVVVPKTKIKMLANAKPDGEKDEKLQDLKEYTIIIAVDEEQYRDLELAKHIGILETRLYLDESQPESIKTFNYSEKIKTLNIKNFSDKESINKEMNLIKGDET